MSRERVFATYTHFSSFQWNSDLDAGQKADTLEWVKSLSTVNLRLLEDIIEDARDSGYEDGASQEP